MTAFTYDDDIYSDLHKDVFGFRPRGAQYQAWDAMTPEQKQVEWDYLCAELSRQIDAQKIEEAEAAVRFEKRVTQTLALGAKSRQEALNWIYEADCGQSAEYADWDFLCFQNGLPYGYFKEAA